MTPRDALEKEANDHAMEHALRTLYYKTSKRDDFVAGYLQAAIARKQEIENLRARVAELEGMVPRWTKASSDECRQLCIDGWAFVSGTRAMDGRCLMVPPIPLPEGK